MEMNQTNEQVKIEGQSTEEQSEFEQDVEALEAKFNKMKIEMENWKNEVEVQHGLGAKFHDPIGKYAVEFDADLDQNGLYEEVREMEGMAVGLSEEEQEDYEDAIAKVENMQRVIEGIWDDPIMEDATAETAWKDVRRMTDHVLEWLTPYVENGWKG